MNANLVGSIGLSITLLFVSCDKQDSPAIPLCINDKIRQMQQEPVRNPPGTVWQYTYNGKTVYFIPANCCDQFSELFDNKCNLLCAPDGGITGRGDGRCPDFFTNRTDEKLIWEDTR